MQEQSGELLSIQYVQTTVSYLMLVGIFLEQFNE